MTDNHNYETPQKGATEWHESLNRNFRYIDRDIEIRDIDAARTDYRPKSGAKFLATDTENVYVGDGSRWLRLATSGENPSFDTVSAKTIVDRNSGNGYSVDQLAGGSGGGGVEPPVDAVVTLEGGTPTAYRADGTQIGQDSDTAVVIEAAVSEFGENSVVEIEPGEFPIDSQAGLVSRMTVRGAGMGATVLNCQSRPAGLYTANSVEGLEYLTVKGITVDGQNQGDRTGLTFGGGSGPGEYPQYCEMRRCEVVNCGPRDQDYTPSLAFAGGKNNRIEACRAENCSSVSIEIKIGQNPTVRDCVVLDGKYEPHVGFCHGISVEKSQGAIVENNYVEGAAFGPALNINNVGDAAVHGNLIRDVQQGIGNRNGSDINTTITGNVLRNTTGTGINIKQGGSGNPEDHTIANNTLYNSNVVIGSHATIYNNLFRRSGCRVANPTKPCPIVGNYFDELTDDGFTYRIRIGEHRRSNDPALFANNYIASDYNSESSTQFTFTISAENAIVTGNFIGASSGKAVLLFDGGGTAQVMNNWFNRPAADGGPSLKIDNSNLSGKVTHNRFDGGKIVPGGNMNYHTNVHMNGSYLELPTGQYSSDSSARSGTYTGNGAARRGIRLALAPEYVVVEGNDGTKYDVHRQFGAGYHHAAPTSELSLTDNGLTVGRDSGGAGLNTSGETYTFYAR